MAISSGFVDQHIDEWGRRLDSTYKPYRKKWPSRLFHHCPLENAVQIIADGNLRSRIDAQQARDVAAPGVIDNTHTAHTYGRMYFRPKTPTQWHIEGIRKPTECQYGEATHAPVLVMLVFDAKKTLLYPGVRFSDRNMQQHAASVGDDEQFFSQIPFEKVYHESGIAGDYSIIAHRCAEVLVPSPFPLTASLTGIVCRTSAERTTLLHLLGKSAGAWKAGITVSEDALAFFRDYAFVDDVSLSSQGVSFKLNARRDRAKIAIELNAWDTKGNRVARFAHNDFDPVPAAPHSRWITKAALADGTYLVEIKLEGQLAFQSKLSIGNKLI